MEATALLVKNVYRVLENRMKLSVDKTISKYLFYEIIIKINIIKEEILAADDLFSNLCIILHTIWTSNLGTSIRQHSNI